ncbi:pentatricopeptide repeat-containing protein, partial [Tanacetum coccineum]
MGGGERYGELEYYDWGLVKANRLSDARGLFDEMLVRDMVSSSWNTILEGYAKAGELNDAFELFERMPEMNVVS